MFKLSFARKFTTYALLIGVTLISFSAYGHCASSTISVTATVLPKTPQIDYKKLPNTINRKIQGYKEDRRMNLEKPIRVNVNLDYPEGDRGISIEEIEY